MTPEAIKDFYNQPEEEIKQQGLSPDQELPEGTRALHEKLQKMEGKGQEVYELEQDDLQGLETVPGPEEEQDMERLRLVAKNIVDCYDWDPEKESFNVVTDARVMEVNPIMVRLVEEELKNRAGKKGHFRIMVKPAAAKSASPLGPEIGRNIKNSPFLFLTARSISHSPESGAAIRGELAEGYDERFAEFVASLQSSEKFRALVEKGYTTISPERLEKLIEETPVYLEKLKEKSRQTRARGISITKGHNPFEILTKGAVEESVENLRERAERIDKLMENVVRVRITTPLGTDLEFRPRPDKKEMEDGTINEPGKISNYPIGEWACSPFWKGASGTLVVDGPFGGGHNLDKIDKPVKVTFKEGKIVNIKDGQAAEMLQAYLESGNNEKDGAFMMAEFGIGTNSKAGESKPPEYIGSTEGEKKYGTVHIAAGNNGTFGVAPDDPNYNGDAKIHCDMVLMQEVTVECETRDGDTFFLIKDGVPQGY